MKLNKLKSLAYVAGLSLAIAGCAQAVDAEVVSLDSDEQIASYGIGFGFAANLKHMLGI